MKSTTDLSALRDLPWLVEARNLIQSLMLRLSEASGIPTDRRHLMLGAAFSLWRAVFLVKLEETERTMEELRDHSGSFLKHVITTNAVSFTDDRKFWGWSSGYYLNNAIYRLRELGVHDLPEHISTHRQRDLWNRAYHGLESLF